MEGLREKKYLSITRKRFDPITVLFSIALLIAVMVSAVGVDVGLGIGRGSDDVFLFNDFRSFFFVVGGTLGILLFQYDLGTFGHTIMLVLRSFISNPVNRLSPLMEELDEAIITGKSFLDLRDGAEISGELLNDIVYMMKQKLFFEEIEDFVTNRVATTYMFRKMAVTLLNKGARIAPALGLLGTVIGLIEVLQSLEDPSRIGPAMSLALMTTAFGSVLGSLLFTPLAGRLEYHNSIYLESNKLLMNRVSVLIKRQERQMDTLKMNKKLDTSA
jgi:chemotaxis protein MotA